MHTNPGTKWDRRFFNALVLSACMVVQSALPADRMIHDKARHPMTPLAKPAYLHSVIDPEFGTIIRRITDVESVADGTLAIIRPMYTTVPAWNADESYLLLWQRGIGHNLYDGKTYEFIRTLDIRPRDIEHVVWHAREPEILFYPQSFKFGEFHRDFVRYNVTTGDKEIIRSFNDHVPTGYGFSFGVDPMYSSWDSRIFGFADTENDLTFAFDLATHTVSPVKTSIAGRAAMPAPSGELFYLAGQVLDSDLQPIRQLDLFDPFEHASLGRLANGHDAYFSVAFTAGANSGVGSLVAYDMTDGGSRVIVGPESGYPYPPSGTHISALIFQHPGWVTVSITGFHANGQEVLDNEILLVNCNPDGKVYRVAHHRSRGRRGKFGYWAEPHAVSSPSGTRIVFCSDWGGGDSIDSYVVELPDNFFENPPSAPEGEVRAFKLGQNFPNPFNSSTHFEYSLEQPAHVQITIHDIAGQQIRMLVNEQQATGRKQVTWDARNDANEIVAAGTYLCCMRVGGRILTRKFLQLP